MDKDDKPGFFTDFIAGLVAVGVYVLIACLASLALPLVSVSVMLTGSLLGALPWMLVGAFVRWSDDHQWELPLVLGNGSGNLFWMFAFPTGLWAALFLFGGATQQLAFIVFVAGYVWCWCAFIFCVANGWNRLSLHLLGKHDLAKSLPSSGECW